MRRRLRETDGRIRRRSADYLAYALLDAAIDAYFPVLERFGERLEELEDDVIAAAVAGDRRARFTTRSTSLRTLRRIFWPLREAMNELARDSTQLISDETRVYFRDLYDHSVQLIDIVETYREMGSDLTDLYLSTLSNRMNEIMRVLTVIATIFMPLSFVVGVYGMNFDTEASPWNMPELHWRYGYLHGLGRAAGHVVRHAVFLLATRLARRTSELRPLAQDDDELDARRPIRNARRLLQPDLERAAVFEFQLVFAGQPADALHHGVARAPVTLHELRERHRPLRRQRSPDQTGRLADLHDDFTLRNRCHRNLRDLNRFSVSRAVSETSNFEYSEQARDLLNFCRNYAAFAVSKGRATMS